MTNSNIANIIIIIITLTNVENDREILDFCRLRCLFDVYVAGDLGCGGVCGIRSQ